MHYKNELDWGKFMAHIQERDAKLINRYGVGKYRMNQLRKLCACRSNLTCTKDDGCKFISC